jgi:hypothetical protein
MAIELAHHISVAGRKLVMNQVVSNVDK